MDSNKSGIDFADWVAAGDDKLPAAPFEVDGWTIATDRNALIAMQKYSTAFGPPLALELGELQLDLARKSSQLLGNALPPDGDWSTMPALPIPPRAVPCGACAATGKVTITACSNCSGDGSVTIYHNGYEYEPDCAACSGEGRRSVAGQGNNCANCNGTGNRYHINSAVEVAGILLRPDLALRLENIRAAGHVVEVAKALANAAVVFVIRAHGINGLIMRYAMDRQQWRERPERHPQQGEAA